jgi:hypothetical protein
MSEDTTPSSPRPGSTMDLSRRMDRMEEKHDDLASEVRGLTATVARVELNQGHAEEVNRLRFGALDTAINGVGTKLEAFMGRIEGIITGEIQTAQSKTGTEMVEDYRKWRTDVEQRLDNHDKFETQGRLLGRIAVLLVTSNVIAIVAAIAAIVRPA